MRVNLNTRQQAKNSRQFVAPKNAKTRKERNCFGAAVNNRREEEFPVVNDRQNERESVPLQREEEREAVLAPKRGEGGQERTQLRKKREGKGESLSLPCSNTERRERGGAPALLEKRVTRSMSKANKGVKINEVNKNEQKTLQTEEAWVQKVWGLPLSALVSPSYIKRIKRRRRGNSQQSAKRDQGWCLIKLSLGSDKIRRFELDHFRKKTTKRSFG